MGDKLAKWREKSEPEKHRIALWGSIIITTVIVVFLLSGYWLKINRPAKTEQAGKGVSPFAMLSQTFSAFSGMVGQIKSGSANVLGNENATATINGSSTD